MLGDYGKKVQPADIVLISVIGLVALVMLFPFYNVLIVSVAAYEDIAKSTLYLLPVSFDLSNYRLVMMDQTIVKSLGVSVFITVAGTATSLFFTTAAAYALSKKTLPFRKVFMNLILFTMFFSGGLIPYYLLIKDLGLRNNLLVFILPGLINTFYLIIMKNYFLSLPAEIMESAFMDGANELVILVRIIIPVSAPVIASVVLFLSVDKWNDWWTAMIFINKAELMPMQNVIRKMVVEMSNNLGIAMQTLMKKRNRPTYMMGLRMAAVVVATVPVLIIYPFLQKYFASGVMLGSVKG